nr:retrovirus-related Pol polyprotein from transposon TNT 1-94 [Tanacetum cinerariifolium]
MKGIMRQYSVARTPQQNEGAERKNKTLIEAARTMLADLKLPTTFWAEAVNIACYVQNRVLVVKPHNKTPYELFHGKTNALSFMRPFGCPVTILNTKDHLGKFDGKADEGFFVGYFLNSKAFRVFNNRTRIVEENLHIRFSTTACDDAGKAKMETVPGKDYILLPLWTADLLISQESKSSNDSGFQPSSDDGKKVDEDPRQESECKDQENEDKVNITNNVNAASTNRVNVVSANTNNELLFDLEMPALQDINTFNFSSDHEDNNEEADMNNMDTTIQVSPTPTTRIHKDHPLDQVIGDLHLITQSRNMFKNLEEHGLLPLFIKEQTIKTLKTFCLLVFYHKKNLKRIKAIRLFLAYASFKDFMVYQMDVKSAFLFGKIKEKVYFCQTLGFEDPNFLDKVYKVKKALYRWERIQLKRDKIQAKPDKTEHKTESIEKSIVKGLQVKQKQDGIFISQDKYVAEIIKKYDFSEVKNASTLMETQKPLLMDEDGEEVDVHMYRSMIGSLMYLTSSRPILCLQYLKGQSKFVLWYPKDSLFDLVAYIVSDYAGASLDRKSTIGGCQFLRCRLISLQCKKHFVVANSTTEVEYVAASSCCGQAVNEEMDDSLEGAATTATSLDVERDRCNISKTQSKATPNEPGSQGTSLGGGPREDSLKLTKLMELCTKLQQRVLDFKTTKTTQALEIDSLKRRVKKLEKRKRSRTHGLKRLYKVGLSARVESSEDKGLGKEDASKQGRIDDIDANEDITLVSTHDEQMFDADQDLGGEEVFVTQQDENVIEKKVNAAQIQARVKEIEFHELEESTTTTIPKSKSQDKGKAKMIKEPMKLKKKDQIQLDEEVALKLHAELQAEFDKEQMITREKAQQEVEANIALIESWDDVQAKINADYQLAERLQAEEQKELNGEEKAKLIMQLLEKRRKFFAAKRAEEKRNKSPTQAQQIKIICTYLKNMEGKKLTNLKNKSFDSI